MEQCKSNGEQGNSGQRLVYCQRRRGYLGEGARMCQICPLVDPWSKKLSLGFDVLGGLGVLVTPPADPTRQPEDSSRGAEELKELKQAMPAV